MITWFIENLLDSLRLHLQHGPNSQRIFLWHLHFPIYKKTVVLSRILCED